MNDERKTQREKLLSQRKNGYDRVPAQEIPAMERYCSLYKTFLHQGKTERECARVAVELAEKAGFKPYERGMELKPGDRIYRVNRPVSWIRPSLYRRGLPAAKAKRRHKSRLFPFASEWMIVGKGVPSDLVALIQGKSHEQRRRANGNGELHRVAQV